MEVQNYETDDFEEREMTSALLELLSMQGRLITGEDPLVMMCRMFSKNISAVKFAVCCHADDLVWHDSYVEPGFEMHPTPPHIAQKFLKHTWERLAEDDICIIEHGEDLPFIESGDTRDWQCKSCCALAIRGNGGIEGQVVMFYIGNRKFDGRMIAWMRLLSAAASTVWCEQSSERRAQACENAMHEAGVLEPVVIEEEIGSASPSKLSAWVRRGADSSRIKALVGIRGSNKSRTLRAVRKWLIKRGVCEEAIVTMDLESSQFRRYKTAQDMIGYLEQFPESDGKRYLLIDEIGNIRWYAELLEMLKKTGGWNVWFTSSSRSVMDALEASSLKNEISAYRMWPDSTRSRSEHQLKEIWGWIFMRDVASEWKHRDIRSKEALAEYYSDHLGESKGLRDMSQVLDVSGEKLSPNTIGAYRKALESSYLIEVSEMYDTFEQATMRQPGRIFWTDLELRNWRFGAAPEDEERRLALNQFYLKLRQKYDKVYTPRDMRADFVTEEVDGSLKMWRVS